MAARGKKRKRSPVEEVGSGPLSDEDDIRGTMKKHAGEHQSTAATHKAQLAKLSKTDPEFYQFLQQEDEELLRFSEEELSDESSDGVDDLNQSDQSIEPVAEKTVITYQMALKWKKSVIKAVESKHHILKGLMDGLLSVNVKDIVEGLHSGISYYMMSTASRDPVDDDDVPYKLTDDKVFNLLLSSSLQLIPPLLQKLNHASSNKNKLWKKLKLIVKVFAADLLQLLEQFTDVDMLCAVLRAVRNLVECYVAVVKLSRNFTKVLVKLWAGTNDLVTVGAFLCLRQLIHHNPQSLESVAKQLYMSLVASARFTAPEKMKLLQTSLVELIKMDVATGYRMCFVYIRQLAVSLRNAHTSHGSHGDATQSVFSWQFLRCLQVWSQLLLHQDSSSQPLVYPLIQICLGTIKLQPQANHFPFHLHVVRVLVSLTTTHNCYVPIATILINILEYKFPTKSLSKGKPISMEGTIRLSKQLLHNRLVQSAVLDKAFELLLEHLSGCSNSIGFPELILPITLQLNKVTKATKLPWLNRQVKQLVNKLEETSKEILKERSQLTFGPSDLTQVNIWESERKEKNNALKQFLASWKQMKELETTEETEDNDDTYTQ